MTRFSVGVAGFEPQWPSRVLGMRYPNCATGIGKKSEPYDSLLRRGSRIRTSMALPSTRDALTGLRYRYRHKKKRAT